MKRRQIHVFLVLSEILHGFYAMLCFCMVLAGVMLFGCEQELSRSGTWDQAYYSSSRHGDVYARDWGNGIGGGSHSPRDIPGLTGPRDPASIDRSADGSRGDGEPIRLLTPLPINLIAHLNQCLLVQQYDRMYAYLISEQCKQAYRDESLDPEIEIPAWFEKNRRDILIMLSRMSGGMNSPDVLWDRQDGVTRLKLSGVASRGGRFLTLDLVRTGGQYRVLLIH